MQAHLAIRYFVTMYATRDEAAPTLSQLSLSEASGHALGLAVTYGIMLKGDLGAHRYRKPTYLCMATAAVEAGVLAGLLIFRGSEADEARGGTQPGNAMSKVAMSHRGNISVS